jgi:predicted enzyme related to lactoylglutathione lyase
MTTFTVSATVLDSEDANALADFYHRLLGWEIRYEEPGWAMLKAPSGMGLSFATNETYARPVWPAGDGEPQMSMHLDIGVDDLDAGSAHAVELGASVAEFQPQENVRVHLDPAGHPFCLFAV